VLSASRRYFLVLALLGVGAAGVLAQHWLLAPKPPAVAPAAPGTPPQSPPLRQGGGDSPELGFAYFLDVDGWYRITPYETAVRSPLDFTSLTGEALAEALPETAGNWRRLGPVDFRRDRAVLYYLGQPTVALSQQYQDEAGHVLSLVILGNVGEESFLLFSHTPETCLPGKLWSIAEKRRESAVLDDRPMYAEYLLTQHALNGQQQMVLYWYLWDNPGRDLERGVLSMRVHLYIGDGETPDDALARAWDFVRALFPATVPWSRF
jgi:hypothetical protein